MDKIVINYHLLTNWTKNLLFRNILHFFKLSNFFPVYYYNTKLPVTISIQVEAFEIYVHLLYTIYSIYLSKNNVATSLKKSLFLEEYFLTSSNPVGLYIHK